MVMEQTTSEVTIEELPGGGWTNDERNRVSFSLDFATTRKLHELAFNFGITVDMALMACYAILLAKYTGEDDPVIGYLLERQMFPIRYSPTVHKPLGKFLLEVKHTTMQALEDRNMRKNLNGNPFIKAAFTWQSANTTPYESDQLGTFELALTAFKKESIMMHIEYSARLYRKETIEQMGGHLSRIVHEVFDFPENAIADIRMMSEVEERQIQAFSRTKTDYPSGQTVHYLFEEQVRLNPDRPAVMTEEHRMSYRELNEHANQLAKALQCHGVRPESVVGIIADRSVSMIVGLTAILKAGGAYMLIEADSPRERIEYMLEDSQAGFLLAPSSWKPDIAFKGKVIYWDNAQQNLDNCSHTISAVTSQSLAYIIYTSGSTGTPTGVMVEHRNIVSLVKNTNYFNFSKEHRILQTGKIASDASTFEIWGSLLNGSTLYLMNDTDSFDIRKLKETIIDHFITAWFLTTAQFHNLAELDPGIFRTVDTLLIGGEALSPKYVNAVRKRCPDLRMINMYGPTENTTFSTYFPIQRNFETAIPIGRPICNSSAYILDKQLNLQPIGVVGELWVGGDGIARGYVNRLELTEAKFVEHPLLGERLYRTGDLAMWLPDGNIEMIGRIDDQVKIRGYRVEPGEIETRLLEHNGISKAAVAIKADRSGNPIICAYFVAKQVLSETEVMAYLARNLPEYFLPSLVVQMESLPLTPNGKVDKKALPDPDFLRPMLVN